MSKQKKEITNKDLLGFIKKLDSRITETAKSLGTKISSVEKNLSTHIKANANQIRANADLIDSLAVMTKNGFDRVDKGFKIVDQRLILLEQGQKDIKLRMNEVAYNFEVKEIARKVNTLDSRVKKLETQIL